MTFTQTIFGPKEANDIFLEIKNNVKNMELWGHKVIYVDVSLIFRNGYYVISSIPFSYLEGCQEEINRCDIIYFCSTKRY